MAIHIDNSILRTTARCDTEVTLRYIHDYTAADEAAPLKSGIAGHEALATYFRGGTPAEALSVLETMYKQWADEHVPSDDRLAYPNVHAVVAAWLESHPINQLPFQVPGPEFVEVGFQYPLDDHGDIIFTGRMDLTVRDMDGDLAPMDHKYTGRIDKFWIANFKNDSQMTGYMWVAGQHYGKRLLKGYVNAIELSQLPTDPTRKCRLHAVPYAECGEQHGRSALILINRTPQQLEEWRRTALKLARRYIALRDKYGSDLDLLHRVAMQGTFHQACSRCSFAHFCTNGRPIAMLDTVLRKEHWDPLAHAMGGHSRHERDTPLTKPKKKAKKSSVKSTPQLESDK